MPQHKPILRKVLLSIILIVALLGAGAFSIMVASWYAEGPPEEEILPPALVVSAMKLERGDVTESLRGFGLAQPVRRARAAAQVQGNILDIPERHRVGAFVERGTVLATIDPRPFEAELLRREAMLEEARENLVRTRAELEENREKRRFLEIERDIAEAELERAEQLFREGAISESSRDQARVQVQGVNQRLSDLNRQDAIQRAEETRLQASIRAREMEVALAENDLSYTTPAAPFDAFIEERNVNEGDLVSPGATLFVLIDGTRLELPIEIPASQARGIEEGAPALLHADYGSTPVATGTIERISPSIHPGSRTVSAYVMIERESTETGLTPGTFLSAQVEGRRFEDVYAIPRNAILDGAIYLVEDDRAARYEPEFFETLDDVALTRDDIPEGSILVMSGFERIYDGARLEVPDAEEIEEMPLELPVDISPDVVARDGVTGSGR